MWYNNIIEFLQEVNKMDKYKKLLSNTLILSIGTFASKLLVYFLMPLYTAILSKEQYGTADLITNAANLLIPFCCIGITHGVFRFAADEEENNKTVFSSGVSVLFLSSAIFLVLSPLFSLVSYFNGYAWLLTFYVISSNFHTLAKEYIRAKGLTKLYAIQGILGTALTIAFNLLFLIPMKLGVTGYVLSVAVADAIGTVFLFIYAKLYKDFSFKSVSKLKIKEMLRYSLPMMPTTVIWWITNVSDRFMVTHFWGSGENGIYSAAYKIPTIIALVAGVFNEAWQLSAISESKDERETGHFFSAVFERYQAILFLGCSMLIPFTQIATRLLLNDSYFEAWSFMPVLLIATVFSSLVTFIGTIYTVKKKTTMSLLTAFLGAVLNIVLNFLLIPQMGAQGAGIATAISYFAVFAFRAIHSKSFMPFDLKSRKLFANTLIVTVQAIFMILNLQYNVLVQILLVVILCFINAKSIISILQNVFNKFDIPSRFAKKKSNDYDEYSTENEKLSTVVEDDAKPYCKTDENIDIEREVDPVSLKVVKPKSYSDGLSIADDLVAGSAVVLNIEGLDKSSAIRLIDFLMGATHILGGDMKSITKTTIVFTPKNVGMIDYENV